MSLSSKVLLDERNKLSDPCMSDSRNFSKGNNLWLSACNMFDEMASNDFDEWRSPNRVLEVVIHRVCYPITESVLHQVFGPFGGVVEQILVIGGADVVLANLVFESVDAAADAYGELYGRNIYDDCCQMFIKWGLPTPTARGADEKASIAAPSAAASVAPAAEPAPVASISMAPAPSASPTPTTVAAPSAAASTAAATTRGAPVVVLPAVAPEVLVERVPEEQSAKDFTRHDFPYDSHDQAPPHRVTLDALPIVLTLDAAAVAVSPVQTQERDGDLEEMKVDEFIEGVLAASRPQRAPPRQPRPRHPRRAPLCVSRLRRPRRAPPRLPRLRRPRRGRLRVPRLRRPPRAPQRVLRPRRPGRASPRPSRPRRRRPLRPPGRAPPRAMAQQKDITSNSPTRCSTFCFHHDSNVFKSVGVLTAMCLEPSTVFPFTVTSPREYNKRYSLECSHIRYTISFTLAYWIGGEHPCLATKARTEYNVLDQKIVLHPVVTDSLLAILIDKEQWPPPVQSLGTDDKVQLRPIPWPSFGSLTVVQLEIILRFSCKHWHIPIRSELPNGWQINGCSSNSTCQVFTFSWISGLHLYLKLMVSHYTLQAILVICALRFWPQLKSFPPEIQRDVSDRNFQMPQFACSFSKAITIDTADNYLLDLSKCAILWLPDYCVVEANIISGQLQGGKTLLLSSYLSGVLFHFFSTSGHWIKVQAAEEIYTSPIVELLFKSQPVLLGASFVVTKTENVKITRSFQAPSTLLWLSSNGMIPRLVHVLAIAVPNQFNIWDPGGDLELPDHSVYKAFFWKYLVDEHCLNLLSMVDVGFAKVHQQHQQQFSGSYSLDDYNPLGMGLKLKIKQELFMIINFQRLSLRLRQFYHQVVDDP